MKLNGKEINLENEANFYQEYWKNKEVKKDSIYSESNDIDF